MRKIYQLSRSESIRKTCGGFGVIAFCVGIVMCLLNANLLPLGIMLYIIGIAVIFEVVVWLLNPNYKTKKFQGSFLTVGLGIMAIGIVLSLHLSAHVALCLLIISVGEVMSLCATN